MSTHPLWLYTPHHNNEFVFAGVGHPPVWAKNTIHGCDGGCKRPDFPGRQPQEGDLALCGAGHLGIISKNHKVKVTYPDGNESWAWVGTKVWPLTECGERWSSRNPCIIGTRECFFDELLDEVVNNGRFKVQDFIINYLKNNTPINWPIAYLQLTNTRI